MQESDALDRKRAVQSLCDYVFDSRRVASKEFASVVPQLKALHQDEDDEVRLKVAECFASIAASAAGRRTFEKFDFCRETLILLDDKEEIIRQTANTVVQRVSLSPTGAESMVKSGAIEKLIERIPQESDTVLVILLRALQLCCLVDPVKALEANGLEALIPLLNKSDSRVQARASTVIKELSVEAPGRKQALDLSALTPLFGLYLDEDEMVKAKSLAAIMMIVNSTPGKFLALENGIIEKILPLLKSENIEIRLNSIKVLTAVGEAPEGRVFLQDHLQQVLTLLNDDIQEIRSAAEKLIRVINFEP